MINSINAYALARQAINNGDMPAPTNLSGLIPNNIERVVASLEQRTPTESANPESVDYNELWNEIRDLDARSINLALPLPLIEDI